MEVLLLALTTILAVTSDQEFDETFYKRLETGYSYGYIGTPPTQQQFPTARSRLECAFYALNSQSEFFTYNKVSRHATENDINIRHKGNEESDEQYSPPRGLIERLPSDQSTQRPEDTRNSIVPVKDSQENEKTTVTEDLALAEEHRESMAEMRQKILNTLEVVKHTKGNLVAVIRADNCHDIFRWGRRFFVSSIEQGCLLDIGWMGVVQISYCGWEMFPHLPAIIYSGEDSRITWNDAIIEPRMSRFPCTHPAVITVLLLTLATILVVSSDQEREASYERLPPGYSYGYLQSSPSEIFYSTRSLLECAGLALSSQSEFFTYNKVKLVVYKNQTAVANIVFDGRNTNIESWFSHEKLKSSHWPDLTQPNEASFSIGQNWGRRFYVWSYEESCETDMGWIAIIQMSWCDWEKNLPLPTILYSGKSSTTTFNEGLEIGDSMAIFIRLKP
ncbi:Hypothetical predicted protein [Octopus vulgaris]|uniref:C-type lectin domain-containing protein n=1 Tax=Octopus vulgaris TaxID=6645 RepID=A0AA36BXW1_OCTVU|nr:Hypothetical predicted protein [Octopus vulgaris]